MPISIEQFKQGKESIDLYFFLKRHWRKAYTMRELGEVLGMTKGSNFLSDMTGLFVLWARLERLKDSGDVEVRMVDNEVYFMLRRRPAR